MNRLILTALVVVFSAAGIALASTVASNSATSSSPPDSIPPDSRPVDGTNQVLARAVSPAGRSIGLLTYRNDAGTRCAAVGDVENGRVGRRTADRFVPLPLAEGGNCSIRATPIGLSVQHRFDDPATAEDETEVLLWGLSDESVTSVVAVQGSEQTDIRPVDGGFIAFLPQLGPTEIKVRTKDGSTKVITTIPAFGRTSADSPVPPPGTAEASKLAREHALDHP